VPGSDRGWDGGGRRLVVEALADVRAPLVVEVGCFLGLSARTWLKARPDLTLVCIDPWPEVDVRDWGVHDWPELFGAPLYETFLSGCWDYRDRLVPVRGTSPGALAEVAACGVRPHLVYIDGDHSYEAVRADLDACRRLFPRALLAGDDWLWSASHFPPRSVREAVQDHAADHGHEITAEGNTWVLSRPPAGAWERLARWWRRAA
jgi:hypothetical protein